MIEIMLYNNWYDPDIQFFWFDLVLATSPLQFSIGLFGFGIVISYDPDA